MKSTGITRRMVEELGTRGISPSRDYGQSHALAQVDMHRAISGYVLYTLVSEHGQIKTW
jgi:hypothetical protein